MYAGRPLTARQLLVSAPTAAYCGSFLFEARSTAIREAFPADCSRRSLPVGRIMLGFGHRRDVFGGIKQRQEPARQHEGVNEPFEPNR